MWETAARAPVLTLAGDGNYRPPPVKRRAHRQPQVEHGAWYMLRSASQYLEHQTPFTKAG